MGLRVGRGWGVGFGDAVLSGISGYITGGYGKSQRQLGLGRAMYAWRMHREEVALGEVSSCGSDWGEVFWMVEVEGRVVAGVGVWGDLCMEGNP